LALPDHASDSGQRRTISRGATAAARPFSTEQQAQHPLGGNGPAARDGSRLWGWFGENRRVIARSTPCAASELPTSNATGSAADVSAGAQKGAHASGQTEENHESTK